MPLGSYTTHWEEEMPTLRYRPWRKGENQLTLSFLPTAATAATVPRARLYYRLCSWSSQQVAYVVS